METTAVKQDETTWTAEDAIELYRIDRWGSGYFGVEGGILFPKDMDIEGDKVSFGRYKSKVIARIAAMAITRFLV